MKGKGDSNSRLVYSTEGGEVRRPGRPIEPPPATGKGQGGPGIRLRLDRRASDRIVTVVTGLPGSQKERAELLRTLKSACGTGGTVKEGALELQGDHRDAVEKALLVRGLRSKRAGG